MRVRTIRLQATRPVLKLTLRSALLVLLSWSIIALSTVDATAQATYSQGLPTIGTSTTTAVPGQMIIDAVQFLNPPTVPDMCGAIAAACSKLSATSTTYPVGATIDARGFTGVQVCSASNATTMLFQCTPDGSAHNATGGKLLLGSVNLYIDGPATPFPSYTDGFGSGIGTPALLIPNSFWGIEGISRGDGDQGSKLGTFISACPAMNPPTGCTHAFPVRSFPIFSVSVSGNTMTINLTGNVTSGTNVYPAELAMVKGSSTPSYLAFSIYCNRYL
jgi:hypothetical protein